MVSSARSGVRSRSPAVTAAYCLLRRDALLPKNLAVANRLIAGLPVLDRGLLLQHSELVELSLNALLMSVDETLTHAWFPVEGMVAHMLPVAGMAGTAGMARTSAGMAEMGLGLVGSEGMVNTSWVLGVAQSPVNCRVQAAGRAFQIELAPLRQLLLERTALRERLHGYVEVRQRQLAQQALCMNYHSVEQRLVRWLLMARDRLHSTELFLTHEVMAPLLGVRRESVTQAASALQRRGLISYSRGYLMLLDEAGLQRLACPCYQADLIVYAQVLDAPTAPTSPTSK